MLFVNENSWPHDANSRDEVFCLAKTFGGHSTVLLINQGHPLTRGIHYLASDGVTRHGEVENLRSSPRHANHCQFTLPGLTHPALVRNLLDVADALTVRIINMQSDPRPSGKA